ncbi:MAG: hypothetical protein QE271_00525 [Bacteriovoracaceae bacterium]|nr:hypothetical protein [Bacteriovoracaceae bacterium]
MPTTDKGKPLPTIQNLDLINLDFLKQHRFLLGNVFIKSKFSDKRFHLLRYGEYLSDEQIEDYQKRNINEFEYGPVVTKEYYLPWFNLLNKIKVRENSPAKTSEWIKEMQSFYVSQYLKKDLNEIEILGMIEGHLRIFGQGRGKSVIENFLKSNLLLFKRQAFLASSCIIPLFIMGHDDFLFLEDVFIAILLCDNSLWNFYTLQNDRSLSYYHDHPLSMEKKELIKQNYDSVNFDMLQVSKNSLYQFEYESVAELIVRHREWCLSEKGTFNPSLINDWIGVIFFFDLVLPYHYEAQFQFMDKIKKLNHEQQFILKSLHKVVYFLNDQLGIDIFSHFETKMRVSA